MLDTVANFYYNVSDMGRAVPFYRDVLGLTVSPMASENWTEFHIGPVVLALHKAHGEVKRGGGGVLSFRVTGIERIVENLKSHDVRFTLDLITTPHGKLANFEDPDGNVINLSELPGE